MAGIKIACKGADSLPLDAIEDFQGNLKRRGKKDIDLIIRSIEKYGFSFPFFVWNGDGHNRCLDGHGRIQALAEMRRRGVDIPLFPVAYIDARDEAEAKQKLLRLNSQYGTMTMESVIEFMGDVEFESEDLALPSGKIEFAGEIDPTEADDDIPDNIPAISEPGDLYELGPHRLLCGDSSKLDDIIRLMDGARATLIFTDPPYGVSIGAKNRMLNRIQKSGRVLTDIKDDSLTPAELKESLLPAFVSAREHVMADDCTMFVCAPQGGELGMMMMMMQEACLTTRHILIWKKNQPTFSMGRLDYDYAHEPILLTWGKHHKRPMRGEHRTSVWEIDRERKCDVHPTMKPVALYVNAYLNNSDKGDSVADLYAGSGTAFIASEQTGRRCYGMEIDPHYCDVIVARYSNWCADNGHDVAITRNGEPYVVA